MEGEKNKATGTRDKEKKRNIKESGRMKRKGHGPPIDPLLNYTSQGVKVEDHVPHPSRSSCPSLGTLP